MAPEKPTDPFNNDTTPSEDTSNTTPLQATPVNTTPQTGQTSSTQTTSPASSFPEPAPTAQSTATVAGGNGNRFNKKVLLIVVAIVVVVLGGAGAAYALYNQPDKVVADALLSQVNKKSQVYKGSLNVKQKADSKANVTLDFNIQGTESAARADYDLKVETGSTTIKAALTTILNGDNADLYVQVKDPKKLLSTFTQGNTEAEQAFEPLVAKLDGKWVKITQDDLKNLNSESIDKTEYMCISNELTTFQKDKKQQSDLRKLFEKNRFVSVKKSLGSQTINGVSSKGYELGYDKAKAKAFGEDVKNLEVFKKIDDCVSGELSKKDTSSDDNNKDVNVTVQVWASQWKHDLTRVNVVADDSDATVVLNIEPTNATPSVTIPKDNITTIEELQTEIAGIFSSALSSDESTISQDY